MFKAILQFIFTKQTLSDTEHDSMCRQVTMYELTDTEYSNQKAKIYREEFELDESLINKYKDELDK